MSALNSLKTSTAARPADVSTTLRVLRSKMVNPTLSSTRATVRLTAACERFNFAAARPKWSVSETTTMVLRSSTCMAATVRLGRAEGPTTSPARRGFSPWRGEGDDCGHGQLTHQAPLRLGLQRPDSAAALLQPGYGGSWRGPGVWMSSAAAASRQADGPRRIALSSACSAVGAPCAVKLGRESDDQISRRTAIFASGCPTALVLVPRSAATVLGTRLTCTFSVGLAFRR